MLRSFAGAFAGLATIAALSINPATAQPAHDWTGFYVGTHIGNSAARTDWKDIGGVAEPFRGAFTGGGVISGFQLGYNRQAGNLVLGVEADGSFADIQGTARCGINIYICDSKVEALGSIAGRAGYASGQFLFYGKAGAGWISERDKMTPASSTGQTQTFVGDKLRWGLMLGAGLEYALTPSLSAKAEYNYMQFNGHVPMTGNEGTNLNLALAQQIHLIKVGVNYKLGVKTPFERSPWSDTGVPSTTNWTGFYAGIHAGGAFGTSDWNSADGALATFSTQNFAGSGTNDGSILGGQVGFNRQFGSWVVGAEFAASWTNLDGYAKCAVNGGLNLSLFCHTRMSSLMMLTGRLGQTYGNFLVYGLAGGAYAREKYDADLTFGTAYFSGSNSRTGYVVGTGVEYAFTQGLSGKIEYNYVNFGETTVALSGVQGTGNATIGENIHLVKLGLNYKLGADPWAPTDGARAGLFSNRPMASTGWTMEVGARYYNSNGKTQVDVFSNVTPGQLNSRLIYGGTVAHAAETFFRLDHDSRVFVKGNFGAGSVATGSLYDEDFPPAFSPYSNTISNIRDSSIRYGGLDLGYNLIDTAAGKFGPYIGYRYFYQRSRGFGCNQVASGAICPAGGGVPGSNIALTETETYRGAAVGINSQMKIAPRWTVEVDASYVPYAGRAGVDNHWARADINPGPETGNAWGAQVEALVSYAVTDRFSVGLGGRYTYFTTLEAAAGFPGAPQLSPHKFTSERYGGFVQASYKIGDVQRLALAADERGPNVNWTGFYAGGHLGAGFGRNDWSDPFPKPLTGDRVRTGGALGGLQAGYNAHFGKVVLGAELRGSFARIEGTETCFAGLPPVTASGYQCETSTMPLATAAVRAGYAFNRSLIYASGGVAAARVNYALNSMTTPDGGVDSRTYTDWGWTIGGGLAHALHARWSVNLDYKYIDLGSRSVPFDVPAIAAAATPNTIKSHLHLLTLGVNYHFSPMY